MSEADGSRARPLSLPHGTLKPLRGLGARAGVATALLLLVAVVAYLGRAGYRDGDAVGLSVLDCLYYASVSITTTGYGDITPVSDDARLATVLVVTPARILFLILLVGTTLEFLASATREDVRRRLWRRSLRDHVVICGFGTKGRGACASLHGRDDPPTVVVVDPRADAVEDANRLGLAAVHGDAGREAVLREAGVPDAAAVVVAADRDATSVLVTLTARALNPRATITAAARETENAPLLRQSGADVVITSSGAAGRLLGLATSSPAVGSVIEDLLVTGTGLELSERVAGPDEAGPVEVAERRLGPVLAVERDGRLLRRGDAGADAVREGDRVVCVERVPGEPA